jgi:putative heme-binding domain-containing protein
MSPALLFALAAVPAAPPPAPDLAVPPGFTAKLFADNLLAPDIYTMTIDDAGRVIVAGRGYVRVLVDENGDGVANKAIDLIDGLKDGPMGLLAEGDSLYVVTGGGLKRYRGYDGRSKLTQPPETLVALKTTGEHDAHAVRRGPDGWLYLLCGNNAGVKKETITGSRSPVKEPIAGALLRISPDRGSFWRPRPPVVEVVADGFRNPYSFDFNLDGEPFTADSDNERCIGLPWYESCRFYHLVPGGNYGWRSPQLGQFWRKPPYFVDCVPPVCYLGRGSPTGVACYRNTHFPERYRGGFFLADWTFGRIQFVPLSPKQSSYEGEPEVFAEAVGTSGFAPTALAVHPKTGELFVSIGGRGTRGSVYRISHDKSAPGKALPMAKRSLEWTADDDKRWLADCLSADSRLRRTTLELMLRAGLKLPWSPKLKDAVVPNLSHDDPLIRLAAGRTLKPMVVPIGPSPNTQAQLVIALLEVKDDPDEALSIALAALSDKSTSSTLKLQALRIVQLALGDLTDPKAVGTVFEGYTFRRATTPEIRAKIELACSKIQYGKDSALETETFRMLACIEATVGPGRVLFHITADSDLRDDIGHLAVLARLNTDDKRYVQMIADALIDLDRKAVDQKVQRDTFWPLRVTEIAAALHEKYPKLGIAVLDHPKFGRPEHLLLVEPLDIDRLEALITFRLAARMTPDYRWTTGQIALFGSMRESLRHDRLTDLWDRPELREAILKVLPEEDGDQSKFVVGLEAFDPELVRLSAAALTRLPRFAPDYEIARAVKALQRLGPDDKLARSAVVGLLQNRTEQKFGDDVKAWIAWVSKNRSDTAKLLATNDGFDAVAWKKREAKIAWDTGVATRGKVVFAKASCAACHDGGRALGPPLAGVAKRFSRDDILTAILQPSKDVAPRYRPIRITTKDEKTFVGMIVYEATDGIILQTNADTSVRIAGSDIASKRPVDTSLMPAGLLDKLTNAEVADLLAYLKSLEEPKPK